MSHPLYKKSRIKMVLNKPYAAVIAEMKGKQLMVIQGSVCLASPGSHFAKIGQLLEVVDENGKKINPSGEFFMSLESIDPFHLIIDWRKV